MDVDPIRPSGISSTDNELDEARAVADAAVAYLTSQHWPQPVAAMSGNGCYVLYRRSSQQQRFQHARQIGPQGPRKPIQLI